MKKKKKKRRKEKNQFVLVIKPGPQHIPPCSELQSKKIRDQLKYRFPPFSILHAQPQTLNLKRPEKKTKTKKKNKYNPGAL